MVGYFIEDGVLKEIYNLKYAKKKMVIPNDVTEIKTESLSYTDLEEVEELVIGKNVEKIGDVFCSYLKGPRKIKFSEGLKYIGDYCFEYSTIENVEFPESCTYLGKGLFNNSNVKSFKLGKNVRTLNAGFMSDTKLTEVEIPEHVPNIREYCFEDCLELSSLKLNEGVQLIDHNSFRNCPKLKNVTLPASLLKLGSHAFADGNYENVVIKGERTFFEKAIFANSKIENLYINIKNRNKLYFQNVIISKINLSLDNGTFKTIETDEGCYLTEMITFDKFTILKQTKNGETIIKCIDLENGKVLRYPNIDAVDIFDEFRGELYLSERQLDTIYNYIYYLCLSEKYINTQFYQNGLKHDAYKIKDKYLYPMFQCIDSCKYHEIIPYSKNFRKWFNKLVPESYSDALYERNTKAFLRFTYNMGFFSNDNNIRVKCLNLLDKVKNIYGEKFDWSRYFSGWKIKEIQHERFRDFVYENFNQIIEEGREDFTNKLHSNFFDIQAICKHKSGRLLKVRFEDAISYFDKHKFNNILPGNEDMANMVYKYYKDQLSFEALQNLFEKAKNVVNDVTKYENYFNVTDNEKSEFTYEFLTKDDPKNLILGHLCDCCAHLGNAGQDIMIKSMTDENYCNLVIKGKDGEIKAKSTIYLNPEKGYAVFNNVEVNKQFLGFDKNDNPLKNTLLPVATKEQKLEMVDCLLRGCNDFVKFYNSNKNHKPIFVVTMGMLRNDLQEEFMEKCRASRIWYAVPKSGDYEMDSQYRSYNQRILYIENDNELGE